MESPTPTPVTAQKKLRKTPTVWEGLRELHPDSTALLDTGMPAMTAILVQKFIHQVRFVRYMLNVTHECRACCIC